ncbi:hypothetical protein OY671_007197 [Metschnikowia pulcherrima]|nr:hypothetical protein OY671_007197 [Metschnikowia pulcherrima]
MNDMVQKWQRSEDLPEEEQNAEIDGVEKKAENNGHIEPNGKNGEVQSEVKVENTDSAQSMN